MDLSSVPAEAWVVLGSGITGLFAFSTPVFTARIQRTREREQRDVDARAAAALTERERLAELRNAYVRVSEESAAFVNQMEVGIRSIRAARFLNEVIAFTDEADAALARLNVVLTDAQFLSDDNVADQLRILGQDATAFRGWALHPDNVKEDYATQLQVFHESEKKAVAAMREALRGTGASR